MRWRFGSRLSSNRTRFPHKGPHVTMPNRDCILDVYVNEKTPLPWANDQIADFWFYSPSSPTYLLPQNAEDRAWRSRPVGIEHPGKQAHRPLVYLSGGSIHMIEYDREVYPEISYISFNIGCMTPPQSSASIEFRKDIYSIDENYEILHQVDIPSRYLKRLYENWHLKSRGPAQQQWHNIIKSKSN